MIIPGAFRDNPEADAKRVVSDLVIDIQSVDSAELCYGLRLGN